MSTLAPVRDPFRAIATAVVPEAAQLDAGGWEEIEALADRILADRPPPLRVRVQWFVRLLEWGPLLRYGRPLSRLDVSRRRRLLTHLQECPLQPVRLGFWGIRTLILAAYYGREAAHREIGYRADPRGWEARA